MVIDAKGQERKQREYRRQRWLHVMSWGTVLTAIGGFFGIWYQVHGAKPVSAATPGANSTSSTTGSGRASTVGRHRRQHDNASGSQSSTSGASSYATSGSGDSGGFSSGQGSFGGSQGGSVGLRQGSTQDFTSGAS